MWWKYFLVFLGALLFDIVPFPFSPAFTIMVFLQIIFQLNVWLVIFIGVAGSVLGRYILLLYTPFLAKKYLKESKNNDIQFLGEKMNENKWKGQMIVLAYSLLPLPTAPLFLGAGISKIEAKYIIPAFLIGKFTSDTSVVFGCVCGRKYPVYAGECIVLEVFCKPYAGIVSSLLSIFY